MTTLDFAPAQCELLRELVMSAYGEALQEFRSLDDSPSYHERMMHFRTRIELCAQIIGKLPAPTGNT